MEILDWDKTMAWNRPFLAQTKDFAEAILSTQLIHLGDGDGQLQIVLEEQSGERSSWLLYFKLSLGKGG